VQVQQRTSSRIARVYVRMLQVCVLNIASLHLGQVSNVATSSWCLSTCMQT